MVEGTGGGRNCKVQAYGCAVMRYEPPSLHPLELLLNYDIDGVYDAWNIAEYGEEDV